MIVSMTLPSKLLYFGLQPALLIGTLLLCWATAFNEVSVLLAMLAAHLILAVVERFWPAHPEWRQSAAEKGSIIGVTVAGLIAFGMVEAMYSVALIPGIESWRQNLGLTFWPHALPLVAQAVLVLLLGELVFYWLHRGMHQFQAIWRVSGHAMHHSYHNLHAINFLTSHPFEVFFLTMPTLVVGTVLGADPAAMAGGAALGLVNAAVAHSNTDLNSRVIGWVFTTPAQHRRHHSQDWDASNSNYGCNAILWDRVFGTYSEGRVQQTGIGPVEPSLWGKLTLPWHQPPAKR
jgi:sterol desaturase/sphingolipid hydroxylase (fatty acid hydroxylase superfamily)